MKKRDYRIEWKFAFVSPLFFDRPPARIACEHWTGPLLWLSCLPFKNCKRVFAAPLDRTLVYFDQWLIVPVDQSCTTDGERIQKSCYLVSKKNGGKMKLEKSKRSLLVIVSGCVNDGSDSAEMWTLQPVPSKANTY